MCGVAMSENSFDVGVYIGEYDDILGRVLPRLNIVQSEGLEIHIRKNHPSCLGYLDKVSEIISSPDYVGVNPKECTSFELVKRYGDNILMGIKLDAKNGYYYVATLHDIKQSKVDNRLHSGRLKKI